MSVARSIAKQRPITRGQRLGTGFVMAAKCRRASRRSSRAAHNRLPLHRPPPPPQPPLLTADRPAKNSRAALRDRVWPRKYRVDAAAAAARNRDLYLSTIDGCSRASHARITSASLPRYTFATTRDEFYPRFVRDFIVIFFWIGSVRCAWSDQFRHFLLVRASFFNLQFVRYTFFLSPKPPTLNASYIFTIHTYNHHDCKAV